MELWVVILAFLGLVLIRVPIAFAMMSVAGAFLFLNGVPLQLLFQRIAGGVDSFPLLAVPLFLLAGSLMNSMGVTDRIFAFASAAIRHIPGGLGHVNVLASLIFAGMSGSIIADAGGLGKVEIRAMNNAGYKPGFSAAVTASSALIGPIIPPSIVMVIYSFLTGVSLGKLFLAGVIPGVLMALSLMVMIFVMASTNKADFPTMARATRDEVCTTFRQAILPLLAPVILVGGIVSGLFTPTESGVIAVIYVLIIGVFYLKFDFANIMEALEDTAITTSATLFILAASVIFSWIVTTENLPIIFTEWVGTWVDSKFGAFLVIIGLVLLLGMVMESIPIMVVFMPTFLALAGTYGIDPIHLGIVFIISISLGGLTPPVGITLYVVMAIANISLPRFLASIWPFYLAIIVTIIVVAMFPQIALWLPETLM